MMFGKKQILGVFAVVAFAVGSAHGATLFEDNFDGGGGDLNGTTPDVTTAAATWVAPGTWNADGTVTGTSSGGSATLAFTPVDGLIYTLDVSLGPSTYPGGPDNDWLAIGFAEGQSGANSNQSRFITGSVVGSAWMLQRGPSGGSNTAFLGAADGSSGNAGIFDGQPWTALATLNGGNADLRIVLDTTGGTGNWTATWFAKATSDATYTQVRAATTILNEDINAVGVARSNDDISASLTRFSLTAVPEPSSLALIGLGGLLIARRRRA